MTPEQQQCFWQALETLLTNVDQLTATEFRSGILLLSVAMLDNGYANFSHEEAELICGSAKNSTMRTHLIHLRDSGVLSDYSTNGTVRVKFAAYGGREMIVHRRKNSLAEPTNSLAQPTNSLAQPTVDGLEREERALSQLLRALRSRDRALSQQFTRNFDDSASSKLVSQLDPTNPSGQIPNELTATQIDPVEEALPVTFLLAAGFWPKTAKQLAKKHPFELLRRAVAFWWCNRRSVGGEFDERPGIVITWLTNLEETVIPPLSSEFVASDLYRRHRTKAEIAADEIDEEISADVTDGETSDEDIAIEYPYPNLVEATRIWSKSLFQLEQQLPASTYSTWVHNCTTRGITEDGTLIIVTANAYAREQLQSRLHQMIKRVVLGIESEIKISQIEYFIEAQLLRQL